VVTDLGGRLRALRRQRGLSIADVAAATGISTSFLSLIENGKSDITTTRLLRLVSFYKVHITDLLPQPEGSEQVVVRRSDAVRLSSASEGIETLLLVANTNRAMLPVIQFYDPGAGTQEYAQHEGEEFLHVLEGSIALDLNGSEIVLKKGDSAYFTADQPHMYRNAGRGKATILAVVTPPTI